MATIEEAVQRADQNSRSQNAGMSDLFGAVVPDDTEEDIYQRSEGMREWTEKQRLAHEKDTLGLYVTGHPFDVYEKEVRGFARNAIVDLKPSKNKIAVAGLVVDLRLMKNKRGQTMCFVTLDDRTARIEATLFSDAYEEFREKLVKDTVIVIDGSVSHDDFSGNLKLRVDRIMSLVDARQNYAKQLLLNVSAGQFQNGFLTSIKTALQPFQGGQCPVAVRYHRDDAETTVQFGVSWQVRPDDDVMYELTHILGADNVRLQYE